MLTKRQPYCYGSACHTPPLADGERLLGDKAYVGLRGRVIAPYKKKSRAAGLSERRLAFNMVHGWYRATIEHCFAFVKRSVKCIDDQR